VILQQSNGRLRRTAVAVVLAAGSVAAISGTAQAPPATTDPATRRALPAAATSTSDLYGVQRCRGWVMARSVSLGHTAGLTRVLPAALWLALFGCVVPPVSVRDALEPRRDGHGSGAVTAFCRSRWR
jgi:hypothetical protein